MDSSCHHKSQGQKGLHLYSSSLICSLPIGAELEIASLNTSRNLKQIPLNSVVSREYLLKSFSHCLQAWWGEGIWGPGLLKESRLFLLFPLYHPKLGQTPWEERGRGEQSGRRER